MIKQWLTLDLSPSPTFNFYILTFLDIIARANAILNKLFMSTAV